MSAWPSTLATFGRAPTELLHSFNAIGLLVVPQEAWLESPVGMEARPFPQSS